MNIGQIIDILPVLISDGNDEEVWMPTSNYSVYTGDDSISTLCLTGGGSLSASCISAASMYCFAWCTHTFIVRTIQFSSALVQFPFTWTSMMM